MKWTRLAQKRMKCGWTLLIEKGIEEDFTQYWVEALDTVGNEKVSTEIERRSDLRNIGEAFLKAYERASSE